MFGGDGFGEATAPAGTPIMVLVQPFKNAVARLTKLCYRAGGVPHKVVVLRPLSRGKAMPAAANQPVLALTDRLDVGPGDLIAVRHYDGVARPYRVKADDGRLTLTTPLAAGVGERPDVWVFGRPDSVDPLTGLPHPRYAAPAGDLAVYHEASGFAGTRRNDEPLLLYSANEGEAGAFEMVSFGYEVVV